MTYSSVFRTGDCYWMRVLHYRDRAEPMHIFSLGHYIPFKEGTDEFSKNLNYFYKYGYPDLLNGFSRELTNLYTLHSLSELNFDYITVLPTHEKDNINPNMIKLAKKISEGTGLEYIQLIKRTRTINKNHTLTFEERMNNVANSIELCLPVKDKKILIIDNTCTTGASFLNVKSELIKGGATGAIGTCIGLGFRGKEEDYDLNKKLKANKAIGQFKSAKISQKKREEWKNKK